MGPSTEARGRAGWFAFAGRAFLSPDADELLGMIRELRNRAFPGSAHGRWLEQMEAALHADGAGLEKEYVRLFLDPAGAPCPPWQSAHAEEPQLLGPAHRSALAWYRAAGVEPKVTTDPADHIGLLLAFYASLIESGSGPDILDAFFEEHLEWMPSFCELVEMEAKHPFYAHLAEATRGLIGEARRR
jgi:TorA maturation chaperone TorD